MTNETTATTQAMQDTAPISAKARMVRHRNEMKELGFKHVSTHLPADDLSFLDREKKIRGLATRGHTMSSLLAELRDLRQQTQGA